MEGGGGGQNRASRRHLTATNMLSAFSDFNQVGGGGGEGVAVCFRLIQPVGGGGGGGGEGVAVCFRLIQPVGGGGGGGGGGCCPFLADSTSTGRGGHCPLSADSTSVVGVLSVCFRLIQPARSAFGRFNQLGRGGGGVLSAFSQFSQWRVCMYVNFYYKGGGASFSPEVGRGPMVQGA